MEKAQEAHALGPEVALGWDFSGIPNPISQIPGFLGFFSQKNPKSKIPGFFGIFGIGIFFRVGSQNPKKSQTVPG